MDHATIHERETGDKDATIRELRATVEALRRELKARPKEVAGNGR